MVHPKLQELATESERFCSRWFKNSPSPSLLVLVGGFGSGKTHTAKAIFKFCEVASMNAFESGKWGESKMPASVFIRWPEACSAFADRQFGQFDDAMENELVVLDDIGAEEDPWKNATDRLCQILSRREKKFTVITTNIKPESWEEKFDGRINDRLLRNSVIVDISDVPPFSIRD